MSSKLAQDVQDPVQINKLNFKEEGEAEGIQRGA